MTLSVLAQSILLRLTSCFLQKLSPAHEQFNGVISFHVSKISWSSTIVSRIIKYTIKYIVTAKLFYYRSNYTINCYNIIQGLNYS